MNEVAIELGLSMAIVADRIVKIGKTFTLHQIAKPTDERERMFRINSEVSACVRKQDGKISLTDQERIEGDAALIRVKKAERNRR